MTPLKRVLAVHYSQSGQTSAVMERILEPLRQASIEVHEWKLKPIKPYPFPWPIVKFFDALPESYRLEAAPIETSGIDASIKFDLVILTYQVWYLAPSQPVTAFLKSKEATHFLHDTPVVTVTVCRNMWLNAHQTVCRLIEQVGGRVCDHAALVDQGPMLATFLTTPLWLWTGNKNLFFGLPPAGVTLREIDRARRFGLAIRDGLREGRENTGQPLLAGLAAIKVDPLTIASEKAARRPFRLWSFLAYICGEPGAKTRWPILFLFFVYLLMIILLIGIVILPLRAIFSPFFARRDAQWRAQYAQPSGSAEDRLHQYE